MADNSKYAKDYSESGFWSKLANYSKSIGRGTVEQALKLYFSMKLGKASPTQIMAIIGALGYLICPVDAIPDILGPAGFVDDAGVLTAAAAALACCKDPAVIRAAKAKLSEWFD